LGRLSLNPVIRPARCGAADAGAGIPRHGPSAARVFRDLQGNGTAPAKPAEDAIVLDTTDLTADEVFAQAIGIVRSRSS